jgi:hypothetical protein
VKGDKPLKTVAGHNGSTAPPTGLTMTGYHQLGAPWLLACSGTGRIFTVIPGFAAWSGFDPAVALSEQGLDLGQCKAGGVDWRRET